MHSTGKNIKPRKWGWLILFTSTATLLCCALPIVLVSFGMGAVVASVYGEYFPFLGLLGLHKDWTFGLSAAMLAFAGWLLYRAGRTCPSDKDLAKACASAHQWNIRLYWASVAIWCFGFFTAYLLLPITKWLGL
jgi:hypothetical protein